MPHRIRFPLGSNATPVMVLGGKDNSLAVTRHLGSYGIKVRVSGPANCWGMHSRYCAEHFAIPFGSGAGAFWKELLLGPDSRRLHGHILFPCSDEALEFVAAHDAELRQHYLLSTSPPQLVLDLLDKQRTLELAAAAGIPAPRFWAIKSLADLEGIEQKVGLPALVKPVHSHRFARVFGEKLFIVQDSYTELARRVGLALEHGLDVMVVEMIPGPDTLLSSYNTYITEDGEHLFAFTKRVIRRYPVNSGNGCYHVTKWEPETARLGAEVFRKLGVRGFANVEFKQDPRDGQLKLIEINGRFTAAHELIVGSGAPVDLVAYCHLTKQPGPRFDSYRENLRLWYPSRDFLAFLQMRRLNGLTLRGWLKSIAGERIVFPLLSTGDPLPMLYAGLANAERIIRGRG
jgi:predicted ATP-grasp superfamily ATP-dependent carboligase